MEKKESTNFARNGFIIKSIFQDFQEILSGNTHKTQTFPQNGFLQKVRTKISNKAQN